MKKIGIIGGMSWESTQVYYQTMNQQMREKLGGFHSAKIVLESLDFAEIEKLQHQDDWHGLSELMVQAAINLELAGAELILLATNTMHLCADAIIEQVSVPFLHIAKVTGDALLEDGIKKALLLGTRFTMESSLYSDLLKKDYNIEVMIPETKDRELVHNIIYKELVHGIINEASKAQYIKIIKKSALLGAEAVVLGCTEISLLLKKEDIDLGYYDTTNLHALAAVMNSLK